MSAKKTRSITFTALIWTGIILSLLGAFVAVLGVSGITTFEGSIGDITIKTTSVGLAILVVGSLLAGIVALRLPKDVQVFGGKNQQSFTEKAAEKGSFLFVMLSIFGLVLLVLSFYF